VSDIEPYAIALTIAALALLGAVASNRVSERLGIPAPAIFLLAASVAADLFPTLGSLDIRTDQRIVTVALVLILFDGGMHIGWHRFRAAAGAIAWLGVAGTFVTAGALALAAHGLFGFDWKPALLIGAALAPTDPAVVFSVLGQQEIEGPSGTVVEGESGANDPVGIALMISLLAAGGLTGGAAAHVLGEFLLQMGVGLVVGLAGGVMIRRFVEWVPLPDGGLEPIRTIACVLLLFAVATLLHGSGFLAVFVAGVLMSEVRTPYRRDVERVHAGLASLGEVVAFVVLGLTVSLPTLTHANVWIPGVGLALVLGLVLRPLLVGPLLIGSGLTRNERWFVLLAGLKGAVPILLGLLLLGADVDQPERLYGIVVVAVLLSVSVQGSLVPTMMRRLGIRTRSAEG
jgi:potassium/hydrogen antiporter